MAIFEWRKFNFFDLKQNADSGKILIASKDADITCGTSGRGQNILCDTVGYIHVFYRNWEYISFKGHDSSIILCALSTQNNLFITVSNEDGGEIPVFKVWNLSKITKDTGAACLRTVKAALQKPTSVAVAENGQFMAIGFDRGGVSLYRGDIGRDRSKTVKTLSSGTSSVTGIAFKQHGKATHMFVCSDSGVLVYNLQNKDKEIKIVLDKTYAPTRCCALQTYQGLNESHFMVGRDDAIYCYTPDGRGPCYALEGQKIIIQWFRSHLLTITAKGVAPTQKEFALTVVDIKNKFIVLTTQIEAVVAILIEFGTCFILTKNKKCYQLDEKDLQSKLNSLFKKNLYDIAIRIAKNQRYDAEALAEIFKQYGDHLYSKANYSGAIDQYIKTIGYLEPSYIIRRYLDSRHIHFLTDYLQALHKQGNATADHTTLLLNCFTRLDMPDKLKEFLSYEESSSNVNKFDLDVAIKVCRNASIDVALELARKNHKHEYCISILIEEKESYEEALDYISELSVYDAESSLKKYGTILLDNCPNRTTNLLKKLCTNFHTNTTESITIIESTITNDVTIIRINPENLIQLFFKHSDKLIEFLEYLVLNINNCNEVVYNTLIELYLKKWETDCNIENRLIDILKTYEDVYDKDHVLVLCRMFNFWPGILWVYEEEKLYHLIVRHYLKNRDYSNLLSSCKRLGPSQPSLWLLALTGLRDDEEAPITHLLEVLNVIATEKLQSPLQVLNCLAVEKGPKFCHVRNYFMQVLQKEEESTKQMEDVEILRKDLESLKEHIENLRSNTIEFRSTICDSCKRPLTLPAVYFICKHSFHQDCPQPNAEYCSICCKRNSQLIDTLHAQNESRNQHETFHGILDRSHEPFSIVAKYFGHGLFNKILIVNEEENQEINQNIIEPNHKISVIGGKDYGARAEAKLRLSEGRAKPGQPTVNLIPKSEGRLRLEESSKYSSSSESALSIHDSIKAAAATSVNFKMQQQQQQQLTSLSKISTSKLSDIYKPISKVTTSKTSTNPFDEDDNVDSDDAGNTIKAILYDEKKNPFAEDTKFEQNKQNASTDGGRSGVGNPFEEYDNNLNTSN